MSNDLEIVANNGKVYKDLRAYHIALGHAVRQALINFSKEVEMYCQERIRDFYEEYTPESYNRTYQLIDKMQLGQLIKFKIQGSFNAKYKLEFTLFDSEVLEVRYNEQGFNTYMSFDGTDVRNEMEMFIQAGIINGHSSLNLYKEVDDYINKHLDERVQNVIDNF